MVGVASGHCANSAYARNVESNDMNTRLNRSSLAGHTVMVLALTLILGSSTAFAAKRPGGGGGSGGSGGSGGTTDG